MGKPSTKNVDGWLTQDESILLNSLAKQSPQGSIVEIGSWKGLSTIAIARGAKEGGTNKVYAVDPHTGSPEHKAIFQNVNTYEEFIQNITKAQLEDVIIPLVMTSEEAEKVVNEDISMIFIDGDHSEEMVQKDFDLWHDKIVIGGILAFHDSEFPGPKKVIEYVTENYSLGFEKMGTIDGLTWFMRLR